MIVPINKEELRERCEEVIRNVTKYQEFNFGKYVDLETIEVLKKRKYIIGPKLKDVITEDELKSLREKIEKYIRKNIGNIEFNLLSNGLTWRDVAKRVLSGLEHHKGDIVNLTQEDEIAMLSVWNNKES